MIRAVFDTNIVLSAFLWGGLPLQALDLIRNEKAVLLTTDDLTREFQDVISRSKFATTIAKLNETPESLIEVYISLTEWVEPEMVDPTIVRDSKDAKVLACALGGKADIIVSGDQDLTVLGQFGNTQIITASEFLSLF